MRKQFATTWLWQCKTTKELSGISRPVFPRHRLAMASVPSGEFIAPSTWNASPGWGWGAYLLPFVEAGNIHDRLNFRSALWAADQREIIQTQIPVFLCPSASGDNEPFTVVGEGENPYSPVGVAPILLGRSHYVASHGQESAWGPEAGSDLTGTVFTDIYTFDTTTIGIYGDVSRVADGPFYRNSKTKMSAIRDGTTHTIFLGEHSSRLSDKTWVGVVPGATVHPRFSSPENGPDGAATLVLFHMGPIRRRARHHRLSYHPSLSTFPTYHVGQMYAEHPGGGNVGMGDGSVHFIAETVDLITWAELSSIG
jgi:prepilin-type processing-associated H-X9-DG protein